MQTNKLVANCVFLGAARAEEQFSAAMRVANWQVSPL